MIPVSVALMVYMILFYFCVLLAVALSSPYSALWSGVVIVVRQSVGHQLVV